MKCVRNWKRRVGAGAAAAMLAAACVGAVPAGAAGETEAVKETADQMPDASGDGLSVDMSTAYPGITVKAGETVSFPLDFLSLDGAGHDVALSAEVLPENWSGYFKGGSSQVTRVHVNGQSATEGSASVAEYSLSVPAEAKEGVYEVALLADDGTGSRDTLTLEVTVSEEEAGESNFSSEYPEQQGASGTTFSFDTTIVNNRGTEQSYSLSANAADGWQVSFKPSGESAAVASLSVPAGGSQGVTVTVIPPETVEKGDYEIPLSAISSEDTLKTSLTVGITGTYAVDLSTPDGRLSFDAYAGKKSSVTLTVTNTGNVDLTNLNLSSSAPTDWNVEFSESTIDLLEAGATREVTAYVTPCEDAITGDYVTTLTVGNTEKSASADFRVSVKTSTAWGVTAIALIVVLVGGLVVIFKKYGRR